MLILAHSDVVPTAGQTWENPPHNLTEKDGYYYGRGTVDDLGYAAIVTELLVEMKNNKTPLDRDIIFAVTGDEERGGEGIKEIIANHRNWIDAEFALNEGGAAMIDENGEVLFIILTAAEKTYQDFKLKTTGTSGHASVPNNDNAIYRMSQALDRLGKHKEPIQILPVVADHFKGRALIEKDPKLKAALLAVGNNPKNPPKASVAVLESHLTLNAMMRTTCVATVVEGGSMTMKNVLPTISEANINCRVLPGTTVADVEKKLAHVFNDPKIEIIRGTDMGISDASSLVSPVLEAARASSKVVLNNAPIIPNLMTGATDSRFLRATGIPSYGIAPIFITEEDRLRVHSVNERLRKSTIPKGAEYFHRVLLDLAATK